MKLINRLKDRFSSEADRVRRERERQRAEYITILRRADNPQPGDEERLVELLRSMNLRLDQAEQDAKKLELISQREAFEMGLAEAKAEAEAAREEQKRYSPDAKIAIDREFAAGRAEAIGRLETANRVAREFQNQLDRIDQIVSTEPWLVS